MERLITTKEAADMLGVTPMTVNRWIRSGKMPAIKLNLYGERIRYVLNYYTVRAMS